MSLSLKHIAIKNYYLNIAPLTVFSEIEDWGMAQTFFFKSHI